MKETIVDVLLAIAGAALAGVLLHNSESVQNFTRSVTGVYGRGVKNLLS